MNNCFNIRAGFVNPLMKRELDGRSMNPFNRSVFFYQDLGENTPIFKYVKGKAQYEVGMNRLRTRDRFSGLGCPTVRVHIE